MSRRYAKEQELLQATSQMKLTVAQVKQITKHVIKGSTPKEVLARAINSLETQSNKVKILNQEAKILGDWLHGDVTIPPPPKKIDKIWVALGSILLLILLFK